MMTLRERKITVNRSDLIAVLKTNLEKHRVEYEEALNEYYAQLVKDLSKALKHVKKTTDVRSLKNFQLANQFPLSHEQDYLEIIGMLEASVDDTITIDADSYRAYYLDNWSWKSMFEMTKKSYIGSALSI